MTISRIFRSLSVAVGWVALGGTAASAVTLHVANNGVDSALCGTTSSPCRTIGTGISHAPAGSTVKVHPGLYGDVNGDGAYSGAEEESPVAGHFLLLDKLITLTSSAGPASTVLRCSSEAGVPDMITILDVAASFGVKSNGFTLQGCYIVINAGAAVGARVSGNRIIASHNVPAGIQAADGVGVKILNNQVIGHDIGIQLQGVSDAEVAANQLSGNSTGIEDAGNASRLRGNVLVGNSRVGMELAGGTNAAGDGAVVERNSIIGNGTNSSPLSRGGILVGTAAVRINSNNIFGNDAGAENCGITNQAGAIDATSNFWGATSGPGANPADQVCVTGGAGPVDISGFRAAEITVSVPVKK